MGLFIIFLTVFVSVFSGTNAKLPDYLKPCNHSASDLPECLENSVKFAVEKLKHGKPEVGIPPLDPLVIENISHDFNVFTLKVKFNITKLSASGLTDFKLKNIEVSGNEYKFDLEFPSLSINEMFVFSLPMGTKHFDNVMGSGKGILDDVKVHGVLKGTPVKVNGKESMKFDDLRIKVLLGKTNILVKIKGHESMEKMMNRGLKSSTMRNSVIFNSALKDVENLIETEVLKICEKLTFGHPLNVLFPR